MPASIPFANVMEITNEVMGLFEIHGKEDYDNEPVSQASHMIQCAMLAIDHASDTELILGAFLHDIGHLLKHEITSKAMAGYGVANHEEVGASFLRSRGFSERICAVVEKHVAAKRYLVAIDETYQNRLSPASVQTLQWQGGPMKVEEIKQFEQHACFKDIIKVRLWDEGAKDKNATLYPLSFFGNMIKEYLTNRTK